MQVRAARRSLGRALTACERTMRGKTGLERQAARRSRRRLLDAMASLDGVGLIPRIGVDDPDLNPELLPRAGPEPTESPPEPSPASEPTE